MISIFRKNNQKMKLRAPTEIALLGRGISAEFFRSSDVSSLSARKRIKGDKGFVALLAAVIFIIAIETLIILSFDVVVSQQKISNELIDSAEAYFAAESGIEDSVYRVKKSMDIPANYAISIGSSSVNVLVDSPNANTKIITATGGRDNSFRKLETRMDIQTINPEFFYGAQAGVSGIVMENNSRVEGVGTDAGNVYSNGPIDGDNGAVITGDVFVATGMSEDQSHAVYNSDQIFGQADPFIDIAQSIVPSTTNTLVKVAVYIKKIGSPGNRTVRVLTDSAGSPSKTVVGIGTLRGNLVGTSYGWVDIVFPTPPTLAQGTTYWLTVDASKDNNDYWVWGKDQNQGYGNGQAKYTQDWDAGSPVWTTITGDLNFKTFMGGQATFLKDVTVVGDVHANSIVNSKVCGDGYYQTIDAGSLNFINNPSGSDCPDPLTSGAVFPGSVDPPLQNMPVSESNINQWKAEAAVGGIYNGNFTVDSDVSLGPKKIDGNLIMTNNNKTLTVDGTIYVTGYLDISNGSSVRCSSAYNLTSCVVVVDGWVHISNNGIFRGSGEPGSYIMILSDSPCDGTLAQNCTDHNAAIDLHNNASGAIFYASDGLIYLHNGVEATELTGKKIHLNQGAVIKYEQGLVNASFSSGPGGSWKIINWKEVE